jgi:hypothetical protein
VLDVTILQRTVPGNEHQEVATCFRLEDKTCFRCGVSSLIACKPRGGCDERYSLMRTRSDSRMYCPLCNPSCLGIKVKLLEAMAASMDGDHLCRDCDGTG